MQRLIVIRGCLASGKSTISKQMRSFEAKMAWIKVDNFKELFDHFGKETWPTFHGAAMATLNYLLKEGYSVVIEGVFQNLDYIRQAVAIADKYQIPVKVFTLKVSLPVLQNRDRVREGVKEGCRKPLGDEEIEKIYHIIENNPYENTIFLNTEKLNLEESIAFINSQFKA